MGVDKLYRRLNGAASRDQITRVVSNISSYQSTKDKRPKHYNSIRASFPGDVLQADLMDVSSSATANKGTHFLLTMIDVYSRYAFATPLKNKNQNTVKIALSSLLRSLPFTPVNLTTDDGLPVFTNWLWTKGDIGSIPSTGPPQVEDSQVFFGELKDVYLGGIPANHSASVQSQIIDSPRASLECTGGG